MNNELKDYSKDPDYMTMLNFIIEYLDENNIHFLMALDWKQEIDDLTWRIGSALKDNFDTAIELPERDTFPANASISYKGVFFSYDQALRKNDFQLGFIDTESDEYVIMVHKTTDKEAVIKAVNKIGYKYQDNPRF